MAAGKVESRRWPWDGEKPVAALSEEVFVVDAGGEVSAAVPGKAAAGEEEAAAGNVDVMND